MNANEPNLPEITIKAVALGVVLSVVLAAANAYLGLFAGMTVSASIPAAVVSLGVLRLFRRSNVLENNIVQTAASAGESLAAGVIFTLPALVILDFWTEFNFLWVTLIAALGGVLGVLFTIPLRRALIVEKGLKFPEGIATAEVLQAGRRGAKGLGVIARAAVAGGLFKLGESGLGLWTATAEHAGRVGPTLAYFGSNLSPALLSVGYIVGLNTAVLILLGGLANWLVAIPICAACEPWPVVDGEPLAAAAWAGQLWSDKTRYLGVGGMLVGGLWSIVQMRGSLLSGIVGGLRAYRGASLRDEALPRTERDLPMKWILVLLACSAVPLFAVYQVFVRDVSVSLPMAVTMLGTGFLFSAVAAYMAGVVGSSNNPISGVTIATVVVASVLLLLLMGPGARNGPAAAIIIGSVVCCAAAIAGDNMQDLKAGFLVGATPWKQQVMQMVGTLSAAVVMAPVLMLLLNAYGFKGHASATEAALAAPQANLMASVARGVFAGQMPWGLVAVGMGIAVGVIVLDTVLQRRGSTFRTPVLAVAIGFYLPLELAVPIAAGGLIHHALAASHRRRRLPAETVANAKRRGLLFASGLITGEALVGISLAVPVMLAGRRDILNVVDKPLGTLPGLGLLVAIAAWLCYTARAPRTEENDQRGKHA